MFWEDTESPVSQKSRTPALKPEASASEFRRQLPVSWQGKTRSENKNSNN